jgi:hypothetical protein
LHVQPSVQFADVLPCAIAYAVHASSATAEVNVLGLVV